MYKVTKRWYSLVGQAEPLWRTQASREPPFKSRLRLPCKSLKSRRSLKRPKRKVNLPSQCKNGNVIYCSNVYVVHCRLAAHAMGYSIIMAHLSITCPEFAPSTFFFSHCICDFHVHVHVHVYTCIYLRTCIIHVRVDVKIGRREKIILPVWLFVFSL